MIKFIRKCPDCDKDIQYKNKKSMSKADKNNNLCSSCCRKGNKNHFFGKKHSEKNILKFKTKDLSYMETAEYKEKYKKSLINRRVRTSDNTNYDVWLNKFGKKIADEKLIEFKKKLSIASSGSNNSMYGKPSPNGSGNGWSGWYNGWRFRSLKEVAFVINAESFGVKWESAEKKEFMIKYTSYEGIVKNYFPDFYLPDEKCLVECKPYHLFNSESVKLKKIAAEQFCEDNGFVFKLIDPGKLDDKIVFELHKSGILKFIDRYEIKWKEKYSV